MAPNPDDRTVRIESVQDITPHNKALYEAGKKLLVESVDVGRDFCKFMTTTTLGAIPAYLGLLKLVLPEDYTLTAWDEVRFLVPAILFLLSSIAFVLGYFPRRGQLSLDIPAEIEKERNTTIKRRQCFAVAGFLLFSVAVVYASLVLVSRLAL